MSTGTRTVSAAPRRGSCGVRAALAPIALLAVASCSPRVTSVEARPAAGALRLDLPTALESQRDAYRADIAAALERVGGFFHTAGFDLAGDALVDSAVVFESTARARESLATLDGIPVATVPVTFSGTVEGRRLFLVSREAYRENWQALYSDWSWTDVTYRQLVVHELTHRAHEVVATSRYGSAEAMGPVWFFEGLAVACAGQFDDGQPLMTRTEIENAVGSGRMPPVSYPLYGRIVRALAREYGWQALIEGASRPGFPDALWARRRPEGTPRE